MLSKDQLRGRAYALSRCHHRRRHRHRHPGTNRRRSSLRSKLTVMIAASPPWAVDFSIGVLSGREVVCVTISVAPPALSAFLPPPTRVAVAAAEKVVAMVIVVTAATLAMAVVLLFA